MVVVSAATDVMEATADANAAADTPENPAIAAAGGARLAVFDENGDRYSARRALWSLENRKKYNHEHYFGNFWCAMKLQSLDDSFYLITICLEKTVLLQSR